MTAGQNHPWRGKPGHRIRRRRPGSSRLGYPDDDYEHDLINRVEELHRRCVAEEREDDQ